MLLEAVPAIYRPALCRLERYLSLCSAIGTGYVVHLARSIVSWAAIAALPLVSIHITILSILLNPKNRYGSLRLGTAYIILVNKSN